MDVSEVRLITISREFGAGGSELAAALGTTLHWRVLDHDLVHRVAERLKLDDNTVEGLDEHAPTLLARVASVLIIPLPDLYTVPLPGDIVSSDGIAAASRAVIEESAESLPLIVVGHGAQCIFAGRPDALHVRVVAPVEARIARIVDRLRVDHAQAAALLRRADADRMTYVQRHFHQDLRNDLLYDIRVNTGRLSIDETSSMITGLVTERAAARAGG